MDTGKVIDVLRLLGCTDIDSRPSSSGWLKASCPFARWNHSGGTDSSPSFAVNVTGERVGYCCFSCHEKGGSLRGLTNKIAKRTAVPWDVQMLVQQIEGSYSPKPLQSDPAKVGYDIKMPIFSSADESDLFQPSIFGESEPATVACLEESDLASYSNTIPDYLVRRGFEVAELKRWGIMTDSYNPRFERAVFPVRDAQGRLLAYSKRATWDKPICQNCGYSSPPDEKLMLMTPTDAKRVSCRWGQRHCPSCNRWVWPKYQHSKGYKRNNYLYGEHLIDPALRAGVLVEGNLDPIKLSQYGVKNAVASLGSMLGTGWGDKSSPGEQLWKLNQHFDLVYAVADGDVAGKDWLSTLTKFFAGKPQLLTVIPIELGRGKDPGDLEKHDVDYLFSGTKVLK